jgi:hypothetical protein
MHDREVAWEIDRNMGVYTLASKISLQKNIKGELSPIFHEENNHA